MSITETPKYVSTVNACKLCTPMGACLALRGIEGAMPFLHGSQGCSTYMRRYIISHFHEPMDIASSSLGEKNAIYGGAANLKKGITNVIAKYHPKLLGIASTCLTETIGDDVPMVLNEYQKEYEGEELPFIVSVSTPSYRDTHMDGFHNLVKAVVTGLAEGGTPTGSVNLLPGFVSPEDLRYLKEVMEGFGFEYTVLPDISETLDSPILEKYQKVPEGGTPLAKIRDMGKARASIEFGRTLSRNTAGGYLLERFGVERYSLGLPIGIDETDQFFSILESLSGVPTPQHHTNERGRLIDAYVDSHKYIFGKRVVVYGEEDLVVGLTSFLAEIGSCPILCASGGKSGRFEESIQAVTKGLAQAPMVREGADFYLMAREAESLKPDLLVGHSKGYKLAGKLQIPLIRVGFPIHDRLGGQRVLHLGYRGAQRLLDSLVNAVIEKKQNGSSIGYTYM